MKIAILDDYQDAARTLTAFRKLAGHEVIAITEHVRDPGELARRLQGVQALVLIQQRLPLTRMIVEQLPPTVKIVSQTGSWTGHIDVAACTERGIAVGAAGHTNYHAPAELAWALILASLRHLPKEVNGLRAGGWQTTLGLEVYGRVLGIYAYGNIGSIVAAAGRAFGMRVICWGREGSTARARAAGYEVARSREEFFETCDIVSLHMPLRPDSRGIVTAHDLARMKPSSLFVNVSRGALVGDQVLAEALMQGRPGRAAVDVYEEEPIVGGNNPLVGLDNCLCTPHIGFVEQDTYERYLGGAFDRIVAFFAGKPIDIVNPEALRS
ncbi:MAG: D-2-hydroxyacid dehydrogenase family protein [Betaproteobacteria bacterium]|nr:MAG: D-2-hydroxyacid dehydrogenase family protein [Betaproteobacteria bacterium]